MNKDQEAGFLKVKNMNAIHLLTFLDYGILPANRLQG